MPTLRNGSNQCECTDCGEFFNSVFGFDKHRIFMDKDAKGKYIENWDRRRCLTIAEMLAKGWSKNESDFWVTGRMPKDAHKQQPDKAA